MNWLEVTPEMEEGWAGWVASRPGNVRKLIEAKGLAPWKLYLLKTSNHRVVLRSVDEGDDDRLTLSVTVSGRFNLIAFDRTVFGIDPDDIEECELPDPNEPLGAALTHEEVGKAIEGVEPGEARHDAIKKAASKSLAGMTKSELKA